MSEPDRKKRSVWNAFAIEQGFKQRQIGRLLFLTFLNVTVSTGAFIAFHNYEIGSVRHPGLYQVPGPGILRIAVVWAALMAGLGGLFALMTGLLMTHRMAGPIHHFKQELQRIASGDAPRPIHVRRGDEFADVADALNDALEALWTRGSDSGDAASLALTQDELRAAHAQILEGVDGLDLDALADSDRARVESWRATMRALEEKLEG